MGLAGGPDRSAHRIPTPPLFPSNPAPSPYEAPRHLPSAGWANCNCWRARQPAASKRPRRPRARNALKNAYQCLQRDVVALDTRNTPKRWNGLGDGILQGLRCAAGIDAQAALWFPKAAEQGHVGAQCNLGVLYDEGQGVPQNHTQAAAWYRKAAEQGLGPMYSSTLACCTTKGEACRRTTRRRQLGIARPPCKDSSMLNSTLACCIMTAKAYRRTTLRRLSGGKAAEQGNATAQFNLGAMYKNGRGVPQYYAQAAVWCRAAAEQGHPESAIPTWRYGLRRTDEACRRTTQQATRWLWYRAAAEQGDALAQSNLGWICTDVGARRPAGLVRTCEVVIAWRPSRVYGRRSLNLRNPYSHPQDLPQHDATRRTSQASRV